MTPDLIVAARVTAEAIDAERLEAGWQAFCPVCRKPASAEPIGPLAAAQRLAAHLATDHDPLIARLLSLWLGAALRAQPDPFHPFGTEW